ncbi:MAG: methionine--tRNA ligase, partial [Candidatus Magasanikbacteria bacterium]
RYQLLLGNDVRFLTGTDEHGQKIYKTAIDQGRTPEDFVAEKSAKVAELADLWNISNDDFIRTTEKRHITGAQKFWNASLENGDIYKKKYSGLYCVGCESFKTEKDLIEGKCPDHKTTPELLEEENYFFKLSKFQKPLGKLFDSQKDFVIPESRYKEMDNILRHGLDDISISRAKEKLPWGIPVPGDDTQVFYVWFDALTNYITALGYGSDDKKLFDKFWPGVHVIGKEINRFHSLLWPAMLMSAKIELPKQIAVHGWMTVDGQKMSKTIGNVINPTELTAKYPLEAVRYFLMREIPFDNDGDFSDEKFIQHYTADLANGLGNFTSRVLTMIEKYSDSNIPAIKETNHDLINFIDKEIWPSYLEYMNKWEFTHALETTWKLITHCDQIISDKKPWAMAKEGKMEEVQNLLYHLCESLRQIAVMIYPVMPETAEKIISQLGLDAATEFAKPISELQQWSELTVGNKIKKGDVLFPRLII